MTQRVPKEGCLLLLPPSAAHSVPNIPGRVEDVSAVSEQGTRLSAAGDARWFCRVSIEVVPVGEPRKRDGKGAWKEWRRLWPPATGGEDTRKRVALLAARHVWGDAAFSERARAAMGLDMTG
jgi:hypothetical protein